MALKIIREMSRIGHYINQHERRNAIVFDKKNPVFDYQKDWVNWIHVHGSSASSDKEIVIQRKRIALSFNPLNVKYF